MDPQERRELISEVAAICASREAERSDRHLSAEAVAKKVRNVRELVGAGVLIVSVIAGAALTLAELRNKPSAEDVAVEVNAKVAPVSATVEEVRKDTDKVRIDADAVRRDVRRLKKVTDYLLEHGAWTGDVLQHIANKNRGPAPRKPERLTEKERELIR